LKKISDRRITGGRTKDNMSKKSILSGVLLFTSLLVDFSHCTSTIKVSIQDLDFLTKENATFTLQISDFTGPSEQLAFVFEDGNPGLLEPLDNLTITEAGERNISLVPKQAGHVDVVILSDNNETDTSEAFVRVTVTKSNEITLTIVIIGWIYFLAWSISFYPQIIENFRRKSVIGLNFDFLALNIVGFTLYGLYNIGLFWIRPIQDEYLSRHARGVIPVLANDVFFPIHAVFACTVTIVQCFSYEKGNQKVAKWCWGLLAGIAIFVVVCLILSLTSVLQWLDLLIYFSYVKLGITLIKYIPQAYMNYRRKSTSGWSIGNILLDFTGGSLSILQMMLIAYNNDDWSSIFGDLTKFGLGMFSVLFDIFFMLQHYVFYRGNLPHEVLAGSTEELRTTGSISSVNLGSDTEQEREHPVIV